jgi:hypothetical protein
MTSALRRAARAGAHARRRRMIHAAGTPAGARPLVHMSSSTLLAQQHPRAPQQQRCLARQQQLRVRTAQRARSSAR